jgi:putative endopeptidase
MPKRFAAFVLLVALANSGPGAAQPSPYGRGIDAAAIDPKAGICQNFYQHACGGFIAATPVDERTPSVSLVERRFDANVQQTMAAIFQPAPGDMNPDVKRLAAFDRACRAATAGNDAADLAIIDQWLARIAAIRLRGDIAPVIRDLAAAGIDPFVTYGGRSDPQDINRYRGEVHNVRLWGDPTMIARALTISGEAPDVADREAKAVAAMTTRLVATAVPRYDFDRNQHPMKAADLAALSPSFDWPAYLALVAADPGRAINTSSPAYLRAVETALTTEDVATLKAYLRWTFLFSLRGELPRRYDAAFASLPPNLRASLDPVQRCRDATNRALGVEFSRELSRRALGPKGRAEAQTLSESIRATFVRSLRMTPWLTPAGRQASAAKLAATDLKIGYPDQWPATGDFPVKPDAFLEDVLAARRFEQAREWRRAHETRSRLDWEFMVSPWVGEGMAAARLALPNGYPDAFTNSLLMTAGFLLPPHFDARAPLEVNYATYGYTFGHELTHVAQTHEFDAQGRMSDIWGAADVAAADSAQKCVVDEARAWGEAQGLKLDPKRQVDENVADFGGIRLAYSALAARLGPKLSQKDAAGMTPAKRFFYAYAQNYCTAETDQSRRQGAATDGHGPVEFRVNGVLANTPAFASAFGCGAETPMARPAAKICKVW